MSDVRKATVSANVWLSDVRARLQAEREAADECVRNGTIVKALEFRPVEIMVTSSQEVWACCHLHALTFLFATSMTRGSSAASVNKHIQRDFAAGRARLISAPDASYCVMCGEL